MSYRSGVLNVIVSQRYLYKAADFESQNNKGAPSAEVVYSKIKQLADNTSSLLDSIKDLVCTTYKNSCGCRLLHDQLVLYMHTEVLQAANKKGSK